MDVAELRKELRFKSHIAADSTEWKDQVTWETEELLMFDKGGGLKERCDRASERLRGESA